MFNVKKAKEVKITQKPLAAWRQSFAGSSEANKTDCNAVHSANAGGKLAKFAFHAKTGLIFENVCRRFIQFLSAVVEKAFYRFEK